MKKYYIYIVSATGIILLALLTRGALLSGKFQYDFSPSSRMYQKIEITPGQAERVIKEKSWKSELKEIFGEKIIGNMANIPTCDTEESYDQIIQYATQKKEKILKKSNIHDVEVTIMSPNDKSLNTPEIIGGNILVEEWLNYVTKNIEKYPCDKLVIETHQNIAAGGPGSLVIGGFGGINHYWLLWHELTHSYFGTHSSEALWLREGASNALPAIMLEDGGLIDKISWNETNFASVPTIANHGIKNLFTSMTTPGWAGYKQGKVYLEKKACELKEPTGSEKQNYYIENSAWGQAFLLDLSVRFDSKNVVSALKAVYGKYRYSNLAKITNKDFRDAFVYYVSKNDKTRAFKKPLMAKQFIAERLCL